MLYHDLFSIGDTISWPRLRMRTGLPHFGHVFPRARAVLHLRPDEVISGIRHRAVGRWIGRRSHSSARHVLAPLHLELHGVPDLSIRRRIERVTELPGLLVDGALIDSAGRRLRDCAGILAGSCGARGARRPPLWSG